MSDDTSGRKMNYVSGGESIALFVLSVVFVVGIGALLTIAALALGI